MSKIGYFNTAFVVAKICSMNFCWQSETAPKIWSFCHQRISQSSFRFLPSFFCDGVDGGGGIGDSCCWILKDIAKGKVYLQKGFPSKLGPQNHFQSIALMFIKFVLNTSNCGRVHLAGSPKLQQRVGNCQASYQCTKGHWPHRKGLEIPVTEKVS